MKKWIGIAAISICFGVYAMVKLSISRYQGANPRAEGTPSAKQTGADDANPQVEETPRAKQTDADDTNAATPEEELGFPATVAEVEAVVKAFRQLQAAIKSGDYEQAWKLTSESFKSKVSLEKFRQAAPGVVEAAVHPESAVNIHGGVRLRVTIPSGEDERWFFIQEDGQWKLDP